MVVRREKHKRKYMGTRRWGLGNVKNGRGKGDRGGVGRGGTKHNFTYVTAKTPWAIRRVGFKPWNQRKPNEITLRELDSLAKEAESKGQKTLELKNYKVLSNGTITRPIEVKASGFSKRAAEKIKAAGGNATVL